jgi:hypothetical protein
MAIRIGYNGQVSTGLVFAFDSADFFNSYIGEPTENRLDAPSVNGYPTLGNWWGTYNTNKYCGNNGCAVYWDIPAISSISNNIITTASSHGIYSFDVIRPETSGGGVSAGTDYFAKKISDTQFSLHAYNGSQGGDQGYINPATGGHKVHDSFWLDQRVSVSASGFPTKWWGAPHLPNSGLVKEIITGGFDVYPSKKTDCMRLHAHRPESADGMAYGANATVVPGQVHTYSFWTRALNQQTANGGGSMSNYNYGNQTGPTSWGHSYTHGPLGVWTRQSFQFTPINEYVISYFWPGALDKYDLANIQVERVSHPTPFVAGTRSSTSALIDVAGGKTIDIANVSFNSTGGMVFDGTNDYAAISGPVLSANQSTYTIEAVFKTQATATQVIWEQNSASVTQHQRACMILLSNGYGGFNGQSNDYHSVIPYSLNTWYHWTIVVDKTDSSYPIKLYNNGSLYSQGTPTGGASNLNVGTHGSAIGYKLNSNAEYFNGEIPLVKVYNRALTASEVSQNFNAYKKRFNL